MSQPQMSIEFTEVDALSDVKGRIKEIRDIKPAKPKISPFYAMVAKNIAAARRMTGLDQSEIGQAIYGRDAKNRICEYETGSQRPSIETLFKLAKALNCSADYLLGLSSELEVSIDSSLYGRYYAGIQKTADDIARHIAKMMALKHAQAVPLTTSLELMECANEVSHFLSNVRLKPQFEKSINGAKNLIDAVEKMEKAAKQMERNYTAKIRSLERAIQDAHINDDAEQGHLMAWETIEPLKPVKVRK
jgi:transcriptional regulator with XRE-family HTH domain